MANTNQPITFLSPDDLKGKTGYQVVDDETHEVTAVILEDGTPVTEGCSYRATDA